MGKGKSFDDLSPSPFTSKIVVEHSSQRSLIRLGGSSVRSPDQYFSYPSLFNRGRGGKSGRDTRTSWRD